MKKEAQKATLLKALLGSLAGLAASEAENRYLFKDYSPDVRKINRILWLLTGGTFPFASRNVRIGLALGLVPKQLGLSALGQWGNYVQQQKSLEDIRRLVAETQRQTARLQKETAEETAQLQRQILQTQQRLQQRSFQAQERALRSQARQEWARTALHGLLTLGILGAIPLTGYYLWKWLHTPKLTVSLPTPEEDVETLVNVLPQDLPKYLRRRIMRDVRRRLRAETEERTRKEEKKTGGVAGSNMT